MQKLVIIDGLSFFFRAYHAVSRNLTRADGLHTNALYGFSQMMLKVIGDLDPNLCCIALDSKTPTFRDDMYPEYKANRKELDPEMKEQIPYFEPLVESFGIKGIRVDGFEADDIIATLSKEYGDTHEVVIVSSDKDLMQLVGPRASGGSVTMLDTMKNKTMGPDQVVEKFGVGPDKVIEVQALIGDSSDNIPGVRSVGPKTAAQLIEQFGTLEGIYENLADVARDKLREKLEEHRENAFLSKKLVTLKQDVPHVATLEDLQFTPNYLQARDFLVTLGFNSLSDRVERLAQAHGTLLPDNHNDEREEDVVAHANQSFYRRQPKETPAEQQEQTIDVTAYETVITEEALTKWVEKCKQVGTFAIDTETTDVDAMRAELVGISLATAAGEACYIPVDHKPLSDDMLAEPIKQVAKQKVLDALKPLLEDAAYIKVAHNLKYDLMILRNEGLDVVGFEDTMLMSACLFAGKHAHGLDLLSISYLNHKMIKFADVAGRGKSQVTFDLVPLKEATEYAAEDADVTLRIYNQFKPLLESGEHNGPRRVYEEAERPLLSTLTEMERHGVLVDTDQLGKLSQEFFTRLTENEKKIYEIAGQEFNIASPKQLGEVLFDSMGLDIGKRKRSTNIEVLEFLASQGHEIAEEIISYRQLAKLRSTYTEALIQQVNPKTKRVHTSYNSVGAATGRMSSSDPNLQNIPIRTEDGRKIRHAFVPPKGWLMMGADYSQVELRLLAHFSGSKALQDAFNNDADVHAYTASKVFDMPMEEVGPDQRRVAKILNFGLIYGMGAFSVAKQIGVSNAEGKEYVERFFNRYDGVKEYMESNKAFAREHGYVETLLGRRIYLPEIDASNGGLRAGAERAAINAPLQGSNADIIKLVMPKIEQALKDDGFKARMLMQVHDELVFEFPEEEKEKLEAMVVEHMSSIVKLAVPLKVGTGFGDNWEDAH